MKINKKVNCSRISVLSSYLFLGTLAIFIGLGLGTCLARTAAFNNFSDLERAVADNSIPAIMITADSITLERVLPVINRKLIISGKTNRSILNGNNAQRILGFNQNSNGTIINSIHFQHGHSEDSFGGYSGGAVNIKRATVTFTNTDFSSNTTVSYGGAINSLGDMQNKSTLLFSGRNTFSSNESTNGKGGAMALINSDLSFFNGEAKFESNISKEVGGAIFSQGAGPHKNILLFSVEALFTGNKSTGERGGAIFAQNSDLTFDGKTKFENNTSKEYGGAILSQGAGPHKNILLFSREAIFTGNKSIGSRGGAIFAQNSDLTFNGEAKFENNTSKEGGGAIVSQGVGPHKNILLFKGKTIFTSNESIDNEGTKGCGGAMFIANSDLTFGREVKFEKNTSKEYGGAIFSKGNAQNKNILLFSREAIFTGNKSIGNRGGAIVAQNSDLIFGGEAKFENNTSKGDGGAIISMGSDQGNQNKNILLFSGEAIFTGNKSIGERGGAIFAQNSDLTFGGDVKFENNSSFSAGGAISVYNSCQDNAVDITFNGLATFRNNSSARGGAIYLGGNISMTFTSGLKLINNSTGEEKSGAIHMAGENNSMARIIIVQKDPNKLTELRGNRSNNGQGHNAFYLEKHAGLNFTAENGNIDLYDVITGDKNENSSVVTINNGAGWFNVKQGGSIANVNLTNRGNLNLAESQTAARPLNFRNSGKIIFGIFPENNRCSGIQAEDITLEEGTILEIAAAEGAYTAGNSYDIMVSNNTISKPENINITLPQTLPRGLRAKADFQDKFYRLLIVKDSEDIEDNDEN